MRVSDHIFIHYLETLVSTTTASKYFADIQYRDIGNPYREGQGNNSNLILVFVIEICYNCVLNF